MTTKEALEAIKSEDRNERVRALRAVFAEAKPEGVAVVLDGLIDRKRRVREVALKSSKPYLADKRVAERIAALVQDEDESNRIRAMAMFALGGWFVSQAGRIPEAALEELRTLSAIDRYRGAVLNRLLRMDLTPEVEDLLSEYVKSGTKEEAVAATRALCGYRVVNWGSAKAADLAAVGAIPAGGVHYWVRRDAKLPGQ